MTREEYNKLQLQYEGLLKDYHQLWKNHRQLQSTVSDMVARMAAVESTLRQQ